MMKKLEKEIPVLICKLEKIFPQRWFNLMQHLVVQIPYEAMARAIFHVSDCCISYVLSQLHLGLIHLFFI
jgi:hypothetical protein